MWRSERGYNHITNLRMGRSTFPPQSQTRQTSKGRSSFFLAWDLFSLDKSIRGVPRWRDRFVQYGIKVSFWGSGTLKIVIYVENYPHRNDVFGWLIITPSGVGGVN